GIGNVAHARGSFFQERQVPSEYASSVLGMMAHYTAVAVQVTFHPDACPLRWMGGLPRGDIATAPTIHHDAVAYKFVKPAAEVLAPIRRERAETAQRGAH